ncbi:hypothetical protein AYO44_12360 [Planctomycetaceae bacterium SCGC AG-212-F19]|nr:hypothetical protein AYO44_12360 [Planctomycetaceae bacterium SCGC AG-212-F19]
MGWTFGGGVAFHYQGLPTAVHADGNNVAWLCPGCGHPVLFVYQNGRMGSSSASPSICAGCGGTYYLDPPYTAPEPVAGNPVPPAPIMQIV